MRLIMWPHFSFENQIKVFPSKKSIIFNCHSWAFFLTSSYSTLVSSTFSSHEKNYQIFTWWIFFCVWISLTPPTTIFRISPPKKCLEKIFNFVGGKRFVTTWKYYSNIFVFSAIPFGIQRDSHNFFLFNDFLVLFSVNKNQFKFLM